MRQKSCLRGAAVVVGVLGALGTPAPGADATPVSFTLTAGPLAIADPVLVLADGAGLATLGPTTVTDARGSAAGWSSTAATASATGVVTRGRRTATFTPYVVLDRATTTTITQTVS